MRLADELLLLAYSDEGRNEISMLDTGLAGGVLLDLALAGRIDIADGRVVVADASPLGDPVLDDALARIAAEKKPRKPKNWIGPLGRDLRERLLDSLVASGVLVREEGRILGLFPRTRYPAPGGEAPAETDVRQRLRAVLAVDAPVDGRTAALAALVTALNMEKAAVPDRPRREVRGALVAAAERGLADDRWAAEGVRKAVEELQAAVLVAVTAATTVTTTTNT